MGRGTRTGLPNIWEHFVDCQKKVQRRGELKERRVQKEERMLGKKSTVKENESVYRTSRVNSGTWKEL